MTLRRFIIERAIPKVGTFEREQLRSAAVKSNDVLKQLGPDIQWIESYVADNKTFCVYLPKDESIIRKTCTRSLSLSVLSTRKRKTTPNDFDIQSVVLIATGVPLPSGPSVISRSYREAVLNLQQTIQHRLKLLDLDEASPADLCFLDQSKISHVWDLVD